MQTKGKSSLKSKAYLDIFVHPVHSVHNGTKSVSFLGPEIWEQVPSKIKIRNSLKVLSKKSKKWKAIDSALVETAKFLY